MGRGHGTDGWTAAETRTGRRGAPFRHPAIQTSPARHPTTDRRTRRAWPAGLRGGRPYRQVAQGTRTASAQTHAAKLRKSHKSAAACAGSLARGQARVKRCRSHARRMPPRALVVVLRQRPAPAHDLADAEHGKQLRTERAVHSHLRRNTRGAGRSSQRGAPQRALPAARVRGGQEQWRRRGAMRFACAGGAPPTAAAPTAAPRPA